MPEGRIALPPNELDLDLTLRSGQCFDWEQEKDADGEPTGVWRCALPVDSHNPERGYAGLTLRQDGHDVVFQSSCDGCEDLIRRYLRLEDSTEALFSDWAARSAGTALGSEFAGCAESRGLRLVRQSPAQCLEAFICSQNNNVGRIGSMIRCLRERYGKPVAGSGAGFRAFPTLGDLAQVRESELKSAGFGYRARYIPAAAAEALERGGYEWLKSLSSSIVPRDEASSALQELTGVGPKVADCVCLYSLEKDDAVPVDVHVLNIGKRCGVAAAKKGAGKAASQAVADEFRKCFGPKAGWAQLVLFSSSLLK